MAETTNDQYPVDAFDVIITNPLNALYKGGTIGEDLELLDDGDLLKMLHRHYGVTEGSQLLAAASNDWRFVIAAEIAEDDFIPRTPYVLLNDDPNWLPIDKLESKLLELLKRKPSGSRRKRQEALST